MIDRSHPLPLSRQAKCAGISRGSVYSLPRPVSPEDLALMRRIDELHLELPFAGSRMLRDLLKQEGIAVGRKHVATLMRRMGIEALYRKPNTSRRHPEHKVYPYLLRGLKIDRPNQAWAMDITYIPMARGFVYLAAVIDWYSRRALAWRVSNTMDADFCLEAVKEAIARHAPPGDLQHRSRQSVQQSGLHRVAQAARHRHQHGRQGLLARQRVHRAAVEVGQVRGGLSACLRQRQPRQKRTGALPGLLQPAQAAHRA